MGDHQYLPGMDPQVSIKARQTVLLAEAVERFEALSKGFGQIGPAQGIDGTSGFAEATSTQGTCGESR